jgi:hypothetical protein
VFRAERHWQCWPHRPPRRGRPSVDATGLHDGPTVVESCLGSASRHRRPGGTEEARLCSDGPMTSTGSDTLNGSRHSWATRDSPTLPSAWMSANVVIEQPHLAPIFALRRRQPRAVSNGCLGAGVERRPQRPRGKTRDDTKVRKRIFSLLNGNAVRQPTSVRRQRPEYALFPNHVWIARAAGREGGIAERERAASQDQCRPEARRPAHGGPAFGPRPQVRRQTTRRQVRHVSAPTRLHSATK